VIYKVSGQLDKYFYDVDVDCPYGMPYTAIYRQAQFVDLPIEMMELFLESGFRRNGNYLYTMKCPDCQACVPIRLESETFKPDRSQQRSWKRNQDLRTKISPLRINNDKLAICDKFLHERFPGRGNSALEYYAGFFVNSFGYTQEVEFWLDERLVAVSIVDIYENAINCVYFYFDPDEGKRSLGTYNIMFLVDLARRRGIKYVYLGLYIEEVAAMNYKTKFKPYYLLQNGNWQMYKS
jgi:arginine-tRNA-protein transferase